VVEAAQTRDLQHRYSAASEVRALAGTGVQGRVQANGGFSDVLIASHRYFDAHLPHPTHCAEVAQAAAAGETPMLVGANGVYQGYLTVADAVREQAQQTVADLRRLGIEHLVMLTGDDAATAKGVAEQVGVTEVRAGLLPEHKVAAVKQLLADYGAAAMVGDGINDAPALAAATVGIAMGAAGTAQALETANLALMADDLSRLPFAVRLSRATMRIIRQNVAVSLGIKAVFLLLVLAGLGSMWLAVFADMGASLLVTLNGMRLLRKPAV
jgi:Cd2+/Zn2+-exporting ATPase